jgi:hypothetical protein
MNAPRNNYTTLRSAVEELDNLVLAASDKKKKAHGILFAKQLDAVDKTVAVVKNTFNKVLIDLKHLDLKALDEITLNELALIVSKAEEISVNLDKYTSLFEKEVKGVHIKAFNEYLALREFYEDLLKSRQTRVFVTKQENKIKEESPVFIIEKTEQEKFLDFVKEDKHYDLFYLRSEEGMPFYDTSFIRHLQFKPKDYIELEFEDPFIQIKNIQDKEYQMLADKLLMFVKKPLLGFFKGFLSYKRNDIVRTACNAIFALMLAADKHNLLRCIPKKPCSQYFLDFHIFLREVLNSFTYKQWIEKNSKELNDFEASFLHLFEGFAAGLHLIPKASQEPLSHISKLVQSISGLNKFEGTTLEYLDYLYKSLSNYLKKFPNGPVLKALDHLLYENYPGFDPLFEGNRALKIFQKGETTFLHLPSPTKQQFIHNAEITDEFKAFIRYLKNHHKRLFVINFQDRTSWKEHARSFAIESLQNVAEFSKILSVVTFTKDTEFYKQISPYDSNSIKDFISNLKDNLLSESCGFYIPKILHSQTDSKSIDKLIESIYSNYFSPKNVLGIKERKLFIDLVYHKLLAQFTEASKADFVAISCKDGVDLSACYELALYLEDKKMNKLNDEIKEKIVDIAFAPAFYQRERLPSEEEYLRTLNLIKALH